MADKGLALIFGPGKKGMKSEPEEEELDESEPEEGSDEVRSIAKKILQACKDDDEDLLVEALEDWKNMDEELDEEE